MFPTMTDAPRENERDGRNREVYLSDGNTALIAAKDPYGFWFISWKSGKTPSEVKEQTFTSFDYARQYLEIWLNKNKYDTKIVDSPVEIPVVERKVNKNAA